MFHFLLEGQKNLSMMAFDDITILGLSRFDCLLSKAFFESKIAGA